MKTVTTLAAGALSAIGATACCSGPLLLVLLGFSGASAARLGRLEAFQPLFATLTLLFLGLAFYYLYVKPRRCAPGSACEIGPPIRKQRAVFWFVVAFTTSLALLPAFSEYLY